ncbi:MAG: radical SAM protein [Pseudomonadota bacterium]
MADHGDPITRNRAERPVGKFEHPDWTADGAPRAQVAFETLQTLWINTGTLCNITCENCYIESSPKNDRLAFITADEARPFFEDAAQLGARQIGFTGGEPFMNPHMLSLISGALEQGLDALVLTNAMRPMMRPAIQDGLLALNKRFGHKLSFRISIDHPTAELHDQERGAGAYDKTLSGLEWLARNGFALSAAGRTRWGDAADDLRAAYAACFQTRDIPINAYDPESLVLFPEMDAVEDPPEITESCWDILGSSPSSLMCATQRMVVKDKGAAAPSVRACTLIPYEKAFDLGPDLRAASKAVPLNHRHCATFCVLGGASCAR